MKTVSIDQTQLVRAIAQLTHVEIDPAEWGWIVTFQPTEAEPQAQVLLPDRINSQGGLQAPHRADGRDAPEEATALPEPVMVSPREFVDLEPDFHWDGEMPDMADPSRWPDSAMQDTVDHIRSHLRRQVEIDGEMYEVKYG